MGKKVIVVPPQPVHVNVNVTVGGASAAPAPPVTAAPAWQAAVPPHQTSGQSTAPYTPPFSLPASDVLRRKVPMFAHPEPFALGDHVHNAQCIDNGCGLLTTQLPPRVTAKPWAVVGWLLVALLVWALQYSVVVPLAWLGAVAKSGGARLVGWIAILFCGFGPFYSLFYLCSANVPRHALQPWGLSKGLRPSSASS